MFDARAVILDVRADRYRLLNGRAADLLSKLAMPIEGEKAVLARTLVEAQILQEGDPSPELDPGHPMPSALSSIFDHTPNQAAISHVKVAVALIGAATSLRFHGLEKTLASIASEKAFPNPAARGSLPLDLAWSYRKIRSSIPLQRICLRDSLALHRILVAAGCAPRLVLGVQLDPFRAHCWLQSDTVVLNDSIEVIFPFRPILIV